MKIICVCGQPHSGKTSIIEKIIKEMRKRRYEVCSAKDIHCQGFTMDTEGKTTWRYREAGAKIITARGGEETDIIFRESLSFEELIRFFQGDFLITEGFEKEANVAKILCAEKLEELEELVSPLVFCICGRVSEQIDQYRGIPVINALEKPEEIVDLIEKKAFAKLPDLGCCRDCGYGCKKMAEAIVAGEASREDCKASQSRVKFMLEDEEIPLKYFVQEVISGTVLGLLCNLKGYKEGKKIILEIEKV